MASFDGVDYSIKPSKSIQRQVVFDGIRTLKSHLDLSNMVYVGFGSIWFVDFVMAHKLLDIEDMVSMEKNEVVYRRALFNKPYATVQVRHGHSSGLLSQLYNDGNFTIRPWVVWLDYNYPLNEALKDDIRSVIERSPVDTVFLVTFNGSGTSYGQPNDRVTRLRNLLGDVVPDDLSKAHCNGKEMQETLADLTINFMKSIGVETARPGGFKPAFRIIYKDVSPMITVGGIMPSPEKSNTANGVIDTETWKCNPEMRIVAPSLTIREASTLQSLLPRGDALSRITVQEQGFDLEDGQIESFERYYREYPTFAQIIP